MRLLAAKFIQAAAQTSTLLEYLVQAKAIGDARGTVEVEGVDRELLGALASRPASIATTRIERDGDVVTCVDRVDVHTVHIAFVFRSDPREPTEDELRRLGPNRALSVPLGELLGGGLADAG